MSFVVYDVETTGLTKGFDQILQFAAVRTDAALNITEQFQARCRLMPHVIPSPEAMLLTGGGIVELLDPSQPSHFEMVTQIHRVLESWTPAIFLGFNSMPFDEEFLRQAFYQCLFNPYLTNTRNNARADVLGLCRVTAALRPDVLRPATEADGRPVFKLQVLAEANGIEVPVSHDAVADVATTLALCRRVSERAPDVWSQFLRFSKKSSVEAFITEEEAFVFLEAFGNNHRARVVTLIGRHSEISTHHYCLDMAADHDVLRAMSENELIDLCKGPAPPVVTIRTNTAPTLWPLYDIQPEHLAPLDETEILARVERLRNDEAFLGRLSNVAQAAEPSYPPSPHVEEQIYGHGFPSPQDQELMSRFHTTPWERRSELARQFVDERFRLLAQRLIYLERPELLESDLRLATDEEFRNRVMPPVDSQVRWRSITAARREAEELIARGIKGEFLDNQMEYLNYLNGRAKEFIHPARGSE